VRCLPYQPLRELSSSLSAADLHVVVMGEKFVGIVHPCKVYNIMSVGAPVLYIGPEPSHITDIASQHFSLTRHGDVEGVTAGILDAMQLKERRYVSCSFSKKMLVPQFVGFIEQDLQDFSGLQDELSLGGNSL
jgi:colanic acid biosynthesis glycosyl transferase WcaI